MDMAIKLGVTVLLGMLIGIEREIRRKPVGLRTCMVISIVSCLLTIISIESAYLFPKTNEVRMDPMRLAAQIISGIGFLGAGVILRRHNDVISGLTTASIIWGAAGIGIACGAGFYLEAVLAVGLILFSVEVMPAVMKRLGPRCFREKEIHISLTLHKNVIVTDVLKKIKAKDLHIKKVKIKDLPQQENEIDLHVLMSDERYTSEVYYEIKAIAAIQSVEIENVA
ncbi:protein SapB [Fictibacillus macauensis ZFHKF-1]|uniref:Protein SapB n=1 Tax=Fictibacillus macauensis ZFHKF-1 TaxID=1196324 RepID=I8ALL3_9BACL|nr:MgtC/SapB family protein [Fictibacillus macauensis]EIT86494.1 protein SapB [Fictibacillus macauensis ZFHKF-1]